MFQKSQSQHEQNLKTSKLYTMLTNMLDEMDLLEFDEAYHLGDVLFSSTVKKLESQNIKHIDSHVYNEWKKPEGYVFICLTELIFENETFIVVTHQEDAPEEDEELYLKPVIVKILKKTELLEECKAIFNNDPDELFYGKLCGIKNYFSDMAKLVVN